MNLLNSFSFELPTRIEYGVGAVTRLADIIKALNAESILVVTDKGIGDSGLLGVFTIYWMPTRSHGRFLIM